MILLDYVVQILDLQDLDQPEPTVQDQQAVHVLQPGEICATLVDDHSVRETIASDCAREKCGFGCLISMLQ